MPQYPSRVTRVARLFAIVMPALLAACTTPMAGHPKGAGASAGVASGQPVTVGIIAINDFHGSIEPPRQSVLAPDGKGGVVQVPAGGSAWLASAIDSLRGKYANHLTVSAGDLISASQLASSLYLDEPTVGVMNRIGLDFNAVGNHEFDRGRDELLRMQNGGCAQNTARKPCQVEQFAGANFHFMAASTLTEQGKPLFPGTALRQFGSGSSKVTVGLIGLTLKGTTDLVAPGGIKGLTFADEADTINAATASLKAQGADAVVVLIHQGGAQEPGTDPNGCAGFTGEIRPILDRLDTRVDLVVSGHTHKAYVCDYGTLNPAKPILLTSAGVYGELVTDIALDIDPVAHRVVAKRAHNVIVQSVSYTGSRGPIANSDLYPAFSPRADIAGYVQRYADAAKVYSQRQVGMLASPATGRGLGALIADAQLAATRSAGAQIAFMNPFGIRTQLVPAANGAVTFGDIYAVQPFNNALITQSFTGAEIKAILEQGFDGNGPDQALIPSAGLGFTYDKTRAVGDRVIALTFNGKPIDPAGIYRVTTNSFLAQGGDSFTLFTKGRDAQIGMPDIDALEAWLKVSPARIVPTDERTTEIKH